MTQYHLISPIKQFAEQYPDIQISIHEEENKLITEFDNDRYDLIIARDSMLQSPTYTSYLFF